MSLSRRLFLATTGSAALSAGTGLLSCSRRERKSEPSPIIPGPAARPMLDRLGTVIGPGKYQKNGAIHYILSILPLDPDPGPLQPRPRFVPMDFYGHGVSIHPRDARRAVIFEKKGPGSCEVDLIGLPGLPGPDSSGQVSGQASGQLSGRVTRTITTAPGRWFYGHGAWSHDGSLLYATETVLADNTGVIVVRDGTSLDILGQFPSHGLDPHDCVLIDSGRVLAITNGGGDARGPAPGVTYVDVATQALLERIPLTESHLNTGHLALSARGDLAISSAPRTGLSDSDLGGISLRPAGGTIQTMRQPPDITGALIGESLSLSIHEPSGIVAVTNPKADLITFWNLPEQRFIRSHSLSRPRGITQTLDQRRFLVSHGLDARLTAFSTNTLEPMADWGPGIGNTGLSGSHLITHAL